MLLTGITSLILLATPLGAPMSDAQLERDTREWHEQRLARLRAEDGWLTLVGLAWLEEGDNPAGSHPDARVALPPSTPPKAGVFHRSGTTVRFTPAPGVPFTRAEKRFDGGELTSDGEGAPDVLRHGSIQMTVIVREDLVGVRVRDADAPRRREFTGIERFPVRADWRKRARWEPAEEGRTILVPNVLGQITRTPLAGTLVFTHDEVEHRLQATLEGGKLFVVFSDLTNRKESYGAGRFLYVDPPEDGWLIADFNRAYNPPCAFSPFATCPRPVPENRLKLRIDAGEKRWDGDDSP